MNTNLLKLCSGFLILATTLLVLPALSSSPSDKHKSKGASGGNAAKGGAVFKANCNMCHNPDSTETKIGPGLKGLFKNKELPASHMPATVDAVRAQIEKGNPNAKPMPMPAFADKLNKGDIENLLAYLKTL